MVGQLPSLQKLIRYLQKVPYLASKNVYRVAVHFLTSDEKQLEQFCQALLDAKRQVMPCQQCFNWAEGATLCAICMSEKRNKQLVCVVETWHDLHALENTGGYTGVYHVLGGALCPLEGIGPEQLTIQPLVA
ncbi:recombination protein RecR, partial [Candidatus Dependentiae bacterium]|nr:recombination protein RecR [Candidatus Dependentiae bacterium]